jgi:hypothetical protein
MTGCGAAPIQFCSATADFAYHLGSRSAQEVRMVVRRLGVWSVARLYGVMSAAGGLLAGIFFAIAATAGGMLGAMNSDAGSGGAFAGGLSALFGVGAIIVLPICYGLLGLAVGAAGAALYNQFAGMFGGIELDVHP